MTATWQVFYRVSPPALVRSQPTSLQAYTLQLGYDEKGRLEQASHILNAEDAAKDQDVIRASRQGLRLLWEVLEYRYGAPLKAEPTHAERIDLLPSVGLTIRLIALAGRGLVAMPISWDTVAPPSPSPDRLPAWLSLSNDARDTLSVTDSIRSYYMVLEDMTSGIGKASPRELLELKYIRDFISHGVSMRDADLKVFLGATFGPGVTQFDPTDDGHLAVLESWRHKARGLVASKLAPLI